MKTCIRCNKDKPLDEFSKSKATTKVCNVCLRPTSLQSLKINLKRYYNLSLEDYIKLQEQQNNRCAICGKEETATYWKTNAVKRLSVDHDHETKEVRGLLCANCNQGLGKFHENTELLEKAVEYLKKYNPTTDNFLSNFRK